MGATLRGVVAAATVLVLAACGEGAGGSGSGGSGSGGSGSGSPAAAEAAFVARAKVVADAWAASPDALTRWRSGFTPMQSLTIEPDYGTSETLKLAFANGWRTTPATLPSAPARATAIRYADGTTQLVGLLDAEAALDLAMPPTGVPCDATTQPTTQPTTTPTIEPAPDQTTPGPDDVTSTSMPTECTPLQISGATLKTMSVVTSRGTATVPAWYFTVAGARSPLVRAAVHPTDVAPQPLVDVPPLSQNPGLATTQEITGSAGESLRFTIGVGACDEDVKGRAHESGEVVVVGGTYTPPAPDVACIAILKLEPVSVTLSRPLGDRLVLDITSGQPVGAPVGP